MSDSDDTPKREGHIRDRTTHRTGKKKHKCIKSHEKKRDLVFDEGIGMDKLEQTLQTVLAGRVRGRNYTNARLKIWPKKIWGNILEQLLGVLTMNRGWFSLIYPHPEMENWVLTKYFHIEMKIVLLKRWTTLFDLDKENMGA